MRLVQRDPSTAYIDNWLWVPKRFTNVEGVRGALSFSFADRYSKQAKHVFLWKETEHHLLVPRHFWEVSNLPYRVVDLRPQQYAKTNVVSHIKLDHRMRNGVLMPDGNDVQQRSFDALCRNPEGVLQLACGKGKTPIALHFAAWLNVPVLIILPDSQLFEQWKVEIDNLLDVPGGVGFIHGTRNDWQKSVVLTTYHTIGARASSLPTEVRKWFGLVIWDEGHHIPAPTFADSAECFYGSRLSLTATPERDDGLHIISQHHIGPVIYKDLTPVQKPRIFFKWTGLEIDESRPEADVRDKNGEIHGSKVSSYNARWPERRTEILNDAAYAVHCGRKVLVLSSSEAEIANMAAMWSSGNIGTQPTVPLYSDIPEPVPADVGEVLTPVEMSRTEHLKRLKQSHSLRKKARSIPLDLGYCDAYDKWSDLIKKAKHEKDKRKASKLEKEAEEIYLWMRNDFFSNYHNYASRFHGPDLETVNALYGVEQALQQHIVHKKLQSELEKRQKSYIEALYKSLNNCGIMVYKVPAQERKRFLDDMPIVFAITKYGKEGMNSEELDTILVSSIFSSQNGLQQLNGRHTRDFHGKKSPVTVFYEDNIGHVIGMCQKLKKHLREWPHDEGGPYEYETIGHPHVIHRSGTWQNNIQRIFGQ